jgi:serine/threonine-protein kinase RsbW
MPDQRALPGLLTGLEQLRQRCAFPGRPAGQLRRWLKSLLPEAPARDDVVLVAVELAANAIKHTASGAGGYFTVEISGDEEPGTVRVTVTDGGAVAGPVWSASPDPLDGHGLGLQLVRALTARLGVSGDSGGRRVWAEVPWPGGEGEPTPAAVPAAGVNGHPRFEARACAP